MLLLPILFIEKGSLLRFLRVDFLLVLLIMSSADTWADST
jgi:hypothetical protein